MQLNIKPRSLLTTLLEVAGFAAIVTGVWLIAPIPGVIALGAALILIGALAA